jgi:SAM-dependent methyltransferase
MASALRDVLDRVPESVRGRVVEVFAFDGSSRSTAGLSSAGRAWPGFDAALSVVRTEKELGRGGSQIRGFEHAMERGCDIVVVLRRDGQDAPEALPELLAPLESGEADAVFGVNALTFGEAQGGVSMYEYFGSRLLSRFENTLLGTALSEFNPGYRLYSCAALARVPFRKNGAGLHFDAQIIIQFRGAGLRIVERPVALARKPRASVVNRRLDPELVDALTYTKNVVKSVIDYELHEFGLQHRPEYVVPPVHTMKRSALSSHSQLLDLVGVPPRRILDIGCGPGELGHVLKERGHYVFGVDWGTPSFELDAFVQADITQGLPSSVVGTFDTVLLADVLEHMTEPQKLLKDAKARLKPGGSLLVSLPNAVHWSMRAQVAVGRFDYTNKGLLDRGHLRFFTRDSARRMFHEAGLEVVTQRTTPVPWENVLPRALGSAIRGHAERTDYFLTRLRPNLFAYQHLFELRVAREAAT